MFEIDKLTARFITGRPIGLLPGYAEVINRQLGTPSLAERERIVAEFLAQPHRPRRRPTAMAGPAAAPRAAAPVLPGKPRPGLEGAYDRYAGVVPLLTTLNPVDRWVLRDETAKLAGKALDLGGARLQDEHPDMYNLGRDMARKYHAPHYAAVALGYKVVMDAPESMRQTYAVDENILAVFDRVSNALISFEGAPLGRQLAYLCHELGHALDSEDSDEPHVWSWRNRVERRAQAFALGFAEAL